jgi:hypothetical protein
MNAVTTGTFRICREVTIRYKRFISNLLSDGLENFGGYGFMIDYDQTVYEKTREVMLESHTRASSKHPNVYVITLSWEDVLTQMILDGGEIVFTDVDRGGEYTTTLTLDKVEKALWKFLDEQSDDAFIMGVERIIEEEYDADDCDVILQYILFDEYMFS